MARVLIVPGIDGSGPDHWQSRWQDELGADAVRIDPASWTAPEPNDWVAAIDRVIEPGMVVVAHSLGCLAIARWLAAGTGIELGAAMLVAPPDWSAPDFPAVAAGFAIQPVALPVRSVLVASDDDPYASLEASTALAHGWESELVVLHGLGHINSASGLGDWPQGREILTGLLG